LISNQTQIGLGGTALGTVAGIASPLFGWWVSGPIMFLCAGAAVWGFSPLFTAAWPHLGIGKLSLIEAAQIAWERAERDGDSIASSMVSADEKLLHFMNYVIVSASAVYGRRPNSRQLIAIPENELNNLHPALGRNALTDDLGRTIFYEDIQVRRRDLRAALKA
jgi:hypothetical protein